MSLLCVIIVLSPGLMGSVLRRLSRKNRDCLSREGQKAAASLLMHLFPRVPSSEGPFCECCSLLFHQVELFVELYSSWAMSLYFELQCIYSAEGAMQVGSKVSWNSFHLSQGLCGCVS